MDDRDFVANSKSPKPPFSIVMPPPNITGVLTLGHVLNNTIQDILARHARMQGFEVLWLPGTDHAGIGTRATIRSGAYENALRALNVHVRVSSQACPLFVPLIEEGLLNDVLTDQTIKRYLDPMIAGGIDKIGRASCRERVYVLV